LETAISENNSLLEDLVKYVSQNPDLPASKIAKSMGVTRHEINSILYKNVNKKFLRIDHGDAAPTWKVLNQVSPVINPIKESMTVVRESRVENSMEKLLDKIALKFEKLDLIQAKAGSIKFEVLLISEGINSAYTRYEVMEKEELLIIINSDSYFSNNSDGPLEKNISAHIYHCIADCLTEFTIRRTRVIEEEFIVIKQKFVRDLLSLDILTN
jgi:hypothetical protein